MSTEPMFSRGPDRAAQEEQDLRAPLTEYPEEPERGAEDGADAGFESRDTAAEPDADIESEYGREHVLHHEDRAEEAEYAASTGTTGTEGTEPGAGEPVETGYGTTGNDNGTFSDAHNGTNNGTPNGAQNDVVIAPHQNTDFRTRWREIQAEFIDDPQQAAEHADHLVAEITKVFAEQAEQERNRLASTWQQKGTTHGTEELRLVMRRYRGLIDHMLDQ